MEQQDIRNNKSKLQDSNSSIRMASIKITVVGEDVETCEHLHTVDEKVNGTARAARGPDLCCTPLSRGEAIMGRGPSVERILLHT